MEPTISIIEGIIYYSIVMLGVVDANCNFMQTLAQKVVYLMEGFFLKLNAILKA